MKQSLDSRFSFYLYLAVKESSILRPFAIFCATSLLFVLITVVFFSYGPEYHNVWWRVRDFAIMFGLPLFVTWLVTFAMQKFVKRERPFENQPSEPLIRMVWKGPSFPSAHAAIAFAIAAIYLFTSGYSFNFWLFVAAAFVVALSRVAVGVHYVSDVVFGGLVGLVVGSASWYGVTWLYVAIMLSS